MASLNERELIARLEAADARELGALLARPTTEQERAYRAHLGDARYERMHNLAVQNVAVERGLWDIFTSSKPATRRLGNVVVLPGIMGSELTTVDRSGYQARIWLNIPRIVAGQIERLRLRDDGRAEFDTRYDVRATGVLKAYYGELLLSLSRSWNVRAFWYDWRKDLNTAADDLQAFITRWFRDEPVHLVAHSMGGLVARTFISRHAKRWEQMKDDPPKGVSKSKAGPRGGRLVMLGTPNHGSYLIPQAVMGLAGTIRKLEVVDPWHDMDGILDIVKSFAGLLQMLPSPQIDAAAKPLYEASTYPGRAISQALLDQAKVHHENVLDKQGDPDRMSYVAGWNETTIAGIVAEKASAGKVQRLKPVNRGDSYFYTKLGDGSVTHALGRLAGLEKSTYYVESEHSALTSNGQVLGELDNLLLGHHVRLSTVKPSLRGSAEKASAETEMGRQYQEEIEREVQEIQRLAPRVRSRSVRMSPLSDEVLESAAQRLRTGIDAGSAASEAHKLRELADQIEKRSQEPALLISSDEREIADLITREVLAAAPEARATKPRRDSIARISSRDKPPALPRIQIRLLHGSIANDTFDSADSNPVDVVSVGHYEGTRPATTIRALDQAISEKPIRGRKGLSGQLLLRDMIDRKVLRGQLGQPFFLDDPRVDDGKRLIAVAGMGGVGSCGVPQLTVLVRELVWSLNRIGRMHLATVLIGAGQGNLTIREAVEAWIRGIRRALQSSTDAEAASLTTISFVEYDALKLREIDTALQQVQQRERDDRDPQGRLSGLDFVYKPLVGSILQKLEEAGLERKCQDLRDEYKQKWEGSSTETAGTTPIAVRMLVSLDRDPVVAIRARYRFSAMTDSASIPEREVILDPLLVKQANDELAGEGDAELQKERGHLLGQLLIPHELRQHLNTSQPLVLVVDSNTARVHWELLAQPDPEHNTNDPGIEPVMADYLSYFLGTYRGLTRQFRSSFASPPEPEVTRHDVLRVLVVADPAEDAPLEGAEAEGIAVADLFEQFEFLVRQSGIQGLPRIEVTRLFGPRVATRTNVLRELISRPYDILHYAGHCHFNPEHPDLSGWIFTGMQILSANEMRRVDRVPRFVFSNACESGITPDRSSERSDLLAPSFAEAFFAQGVSNFVCTAWPVGDEAALKFAITLYQELLGLAAVDQDSSSSRRYTLVEKGSDRAIYRAMKHARIMVASDPGGGRTWGAYQHYGNPYFRLID